MTAQKKEMSTWDYVWDKIATIWIWGGPVCAIGCAVYAFFHGWGVLGAIAGLVIGFFAVASIPVILFGIPALLVYGWSSVFGSSKPAYTNQQLHNIAWYSWLSENK